MQPINFTSFVIDSVGTLLCLGVGTVLELGVVAAWKEYDEKWPPVRAAIRGWLGR